MTDLGGATRAMRAVVGTAVVAAAAFGAGGCVDTLDPSSDSSNAVVEWVIDGDTLRLEGGDEVRLLQIDAPETREDCFGRRATRALIDLTPKGSRVVLETDPDLDRVDKHGRPLRYVFVGSTNVNVELVRQGAATPYFFRNDRGRYAEELLDALDEARDDGRGLWGACPRAQLNTGLGSVTGPASTERG